MQLVGSVFTCEVPDDWREVRQPGCVIAAAPRAQAGFTANVVLRESRIEQRPDALASVSQANLRGVSGTESGTTVFHVEALTHLGAEHRRLWMLTPVAPEAAQGHTLSLLTIQDLVVVQGFVAELTLTMLFAEWRPHHPYQAILDTLHPMPVAEHVAPPTTADVPAAVLDQWATARDGAPREDLSVVQPPPLVLSAAPFTLGGEAAEAFVTSAQRRSFAPFTGQARQDLLATGLVAEDGLLTSAGFWYADHVLSGEGWTITVVGSPSRKFQFWVTDSSTLFIAPHPEQPEQRLLGYCHSNDLFRILLGWVHATPAWPMNVTMTLTRAELETKVERDVTPPGHHDPDTTEFLRQPWRYLSLTASDGEAHLNWIHTPMRGQALNWATPTPGAPLPIRQDPDQPFWLRLTATIAEGGHPR